MDPIFYYVVALQVIATVSLTVYIVMTVRYTLGRFEEAIDILLNLKVRLRRIEQVCPKVACPTPPGEVDSCKETGCPVQLPFLQLIPEDCPVAGCAQSRFTKSREVKQQQVTK